MNPLYSYILEVAAGSGILVGTYVLLLEKRASFRICRTYLLVSGLFAAVVPLLDIPVWSAPSAKEVAQAAVGIPAATVLADKGTPVPWPAVIAAVWIAGILFLGSAMLRQFVTVRSLRRKARRTATSGYTIALTHEPTGSFSFLRTIYLREGTPEPQQSHIIAHEASHIFHRHTYERLVMEGLKILFWWNPFVRLTVCKLIEVHEFEADRDVLARGYAPSAYADTIFAQFFGHNPDIANGLHDSLTKKRLLMMTTNSPGRHSLLRLAATLPAIFGVLCAFAFTTRAADLAEPFPASGNPPSTTESPQTMLPSCSDREADPGEPFLVVETMPRFRGGELNDFRNWVQAQLVYPAEARKKRLSGRVIVKFVVEKDGSLTDVKIVESPDEALSNEVIRVLKLSPKWTPGMQRGQNVRVQFTLPIAFSLPQQQQH